MSLTTSNGRGERTTEFIIVAAFCALCAAGFVWARCGALAYSAALVASVYVAGRAHVKAALVSRGRFEVNTDARK